MGDRNELVQLKMYRSGENLYEKIIKFQGESEELIIFTPYIQSSALNTMLKENSCKVNSIVSTWRPKDFASGANDIEVFKTCQSYNIPLIINNRLHAKVYLNYPKNSLITTANISDRALGITNDQYNYELGAVIENTLEDITYFDKILIEAVEINEKNYEDMKAYLQSTSNDDMPDEYNVAIHEDHFLMSALPMSESVKDIYRIYSGDMGLSIEVKQAALHDLYKYSIPFGLDHDSFLKKLKTNFFAHKFIKSLLKYNGEGRRFGELRAWIQDNTTSVPVPRRFEINDPLNHVYNLVTELSDREYKKIQPGRHTWVLKKMK